MPSFSALFSTLVLGLALLAPNAVAQPTFGHSLQARHDTFTYVSRSAPSATPLVKRQETNAERLRRGLNPRRPEHLHVAGRALVARQSATFPTPTDVALVAAPTPAGNCQTGNIAVSGSGINGQLGSGLTSGVYTLADQDHSPLRVTFCTTGDNQTTNIQTLENGFAPHPYLAFAGSNGDLSPGTPNYAVLGGSQQTDPGSHGVTANSCGNGSSAQSNIWTVDPSTQKVSVKYLNSDGSIPNVNLLWVAKDSDFVITADTEKFNSESLGVPVDFTFVPIA
ncbi:hypothetical protein C8Q75DRAFT_743747 [Abortiporus biennis]|nr:hypothetical protein C8Q75DRAFT_743747 [Abortiporus biennis]